MRSQHSRYVRDVCAVDVAVADQVTAEAITRQSVEGEGVFNAIEKCLATIDPELHIEKIGFARLVIETVTQFAAQQEDNSDAAAALRDFETKMKSLFQRLRQMQRQAERELTSERVSARVNRAKASFLQDHPTGARREHVFVLFEEIEAALDNSEEADEITRELQSLRRDFRIDDDLTEGVDDYQRFRDRLEQLRYAGRLATQQPTLQEVPVQATKAVAPSPQPPAAPAEEQERAAEDVAEVSARVGGEQEA